MRTVSVQQQEVILLLIIILMLIMIMIMIIGNVGRPVGSVSKKPRANPPKAKGNTTNKLI